MARTCSNDKSFHYHVQGVMQVLMIDSTVPATNISYSPVNILATVGNGSAYIGLTGSDGGVTAVQTVTNFLYSLHDASRSRHRERRAGERGRVLPVSVSSLFTLLQSSSVTGPWSPVVPVSSTITGLQNRVTLSGGGRAAYYKLQLNDPNAP